MEPETTPRSSWLGLTAMGWTALGGVVIAGLVAASINPLLGLAVGVAAGAFGLKYLWPRIKGL